jgi:uncharacterized Zn finger protein
MWYDSFYPRYPRSRPRAAKGGIRAQSRRGTFGESWWAKRWLSVLESFDIGARLGRGRSYARNGQVLSIDVGKGTVTAKVQGSRPKPYDIKIQVKTLAGTQWQKLTRALAGQAIFTAKLLAGEMPQDIEKAFEDVDLSLFPGRLNDLETDCSCPDWSNPCKHIAAVYYLIGEEFDRDPFLLFKMRGLTREELFAQLKAGDKKKRKAAASPAAPVKPVAHPVAPPEPLPEEAAAFWASASLPEGWLGDVQPPPVTAGLLKRLGSFPFWRGRERFLEALEPVYREASAHAMDVLAGTGDR